MKIKIKVKDFLKKHIFLRKIARKVYIIKNKLKYKINTMGIKVDEKTIIFGCFNGRSYCDSPKAIYEYMINCNEYKDFNFIWTFEDVKSHEYLKNNSNTRIVKYKVKEFYKALAKSKYWIFNYKIQDHIFPKKNQIFLQCWHGTPLKRLGCDLEHFNNAMNSISEIRQRYHIEANKFNYFISPSKFATEKFISIWDLERINKADIIIEEGYPRNDFLINFKQKDIDNIKKKLKIDNINKKVILYAPTYRDNQHSSKDGYTY